MKLILSGKVELGDDSRVSDDGELNGAVHIGGKDLVLEVENCDFKGKVYLAFASDYIIGDTGYEGALKVATGWGYSEYTPIDSDELFIGHHDILGILRKLDGREITIWVADEPINVLAGVQAPPRRQT